MDANDTVLIGFCPECGQQYEKTELGGNEHECRGEESGESRS